MQAQKSNQLHFINSNGAFRADLDTGLATKAFIGMNRLGLAILHLKYLSRAGIDTLLITSAFVFINNNFPHDFSSRGYE